MLDLLDYGNKAIYIGADQKLSWGTILVKKCVCDLVKALCGKPVKSLGRTDETPLVAVGMGQPPGCGAAQKLLWGAHPSAEEILFVAFLKLSHFPNHVLGARFFFTFATVWV